MKLYPPSWLQFKGTCNILHCPAALVLALISTTLMGETDEKTWDIFNLRTSTGYQSNIFEVNNRIETPTASFFQETTFDASLPLDGKGGDVTAKLNGEWKKYFKHGEVDEYLIKPKLDWRVVDDDASTLHLEMRAARLRERIYSPFTRLPENSETGWSAGVGWKLERKLANESQFTWDGGTDYQWFDEVPFGNVVISTKAELERTLNDHIEWTAATKWDFQHYRQRPPDDVPAGTPRDLSTLEGRAMSGIRWKPRGGWHAAMELNGGYKFDLTNGYYDAGVVGVQFELGWESDEWKLKLGAEPEWVWFRNRPANVSNSRRRLFTEEYIFEAEMQYAIAKHCSIFAAAGVHVQCVNADESRPDATLNPFTDRTARIGVTCSF